MKKLIVFLCVLCLSALALCACSPQEDEIQKQFEQNGYVTTELDEGEVIDYGFSADKVEFMMVATKDSNKAFIVKFKEGGDATELYNNKYKISENSGSGVAKKGNIVVYGDTESVELFHNKK